MVKKLSCVSCGSLKRFPHTFTNVGQPTILEPLPSVEPERITSQFNELQMNEIMKMWSSHHTPKNFASSFYIFLWNKVSTHNVFKIEMFGKE